MTLPLSSHGVRGGCSRSVGRHAGSRSFVTGSTGNCENEGMTDNLGWMLYSGYAVFGVCCTWC